MTSLLTPLVSPLPQHPLPSHFKNIESLSEVCYKLGTMTTEQVAVASPAVAQLAQAATHQVAQQQQQQQPPQKVEPGTQQDQKGQPQAQQQQPQTPSSQPEASSQASQIVSSLIANYIASIPENSRDGQRCLWEGCSERFGSAEELYEHICSQHIGRKSTNNLQLACRWANCNITTVKRDHITSHVRVHVPFKPHRCPVCGKSFKRPQDLKKHHKTHAEENASTQDGHSRGGPNGHSGSNGTNGYNSMNGNGASFYGGAGMHNGVGMNFPYNGQNGGGYYHQPAAHMTNSFGQVYYNVDPAGPQVSYRREDDLHTLNSLFGTIKQPNFNAASYPQFSSALTSAHGVILPPPVVNSAHTMNYSSAMDQSYPAHLPQLTNVTSKADLLLLQDRLQKMMQAIDAHDRSQQVMAQANYNAQHAARHSLSDTSDHTPGLTPSSSVMSYSPGHSPPADHSPVSATSMPSYPHLHNTMMGLSSGVPTLGTQYDHGIPQRHSGGRLQRAQPASAHEVATEPSEPAGKAAATTTTEDANIDPTLAGAATEDPDSGAATPRPQSRAGSDLEEGEQTAVERDGHIVSNLLEYVKTLLDSGDYEKSRQATPAADNDTAPAATTAESVASPVAANSPGSKMDLDLKADDDNNDENDKEILYPVLPS